ncbi:RNA polymerase factor sigma-54 [Eggerthella sp. YY7918]|uniref:RNA polymerase factor sigma-54 n=1 Tax=Eggerthella sp. (strain YY7918) TaxID=502558 RepID=UPI0002170F40|nr:RNA polymerase factor sigma-54 [Eggerthella sp. YY7918]BAK43884.1 DNA-directed RNA polymerase specialized sigma subunit, sigma54 homolog [Eggerthella sp. YY7918]
MKQTQRITQNLGLAQRQIQAMNLLAMSTIELGTYLEEVALENPVIEVIQPDIEMSMPQGRGLFLPGVQGDVLQDDWLDNKLIDGDAVDKEAYLLGQVDLGRLTRDEARAIRYLIGMLDENGYLLQSVEQAARSLDIDRVVVAAMLRLLQSLEPHGIGARTVRESLSLQLAALPSDKEVEIALSIVRDHLPLLAKNRIPDLKRAYPKVPHQDLLKALELIRSLDPRPGSLFAVDRTQYVLADVIVEDTPEGFEVKLGPAGGYDIRLDGVYRTLAKDASNSDTTTWIEAKYRQAYWLRSCLKQRRELMLAIVQQLVQRQKAFFSFGPRHLAEATMSQVAEDLSLSVSTVSRAAKGTYVQCRWGVFPMRSLFSHSSITRSAASGDPRVLLREIIAAECQEKPLSDQKIVEEFAKRGVELSRRTVARYRQELGIPPASQRRYR